MLILRGASSAAGRVSSGMENIYFLGRLRLEKERHILRSHMLMKVRLTGLTTHLRRLLTAHPVLEPRIV
jgi:hypothetical protein